MDGSGASVDSLETGSTLVGKVGGAGSSLQLVMGASAEATAAQSSRMFAESKTDRRRREGIFSSVFRLSEFLRQKDSESPQNTKEFA